MGDDDVRDALQRHWAASGANDFAAERQIYRDDAVLEYPQSGERTGVAPISRRPVPPRRTPNASRSDAMLGGGALWINELVLTYDEQPYCVVSIMEFRDGTVFREAEYFAEPFTAPSWRATWVKPAGGKG